ncbi:integrase core domain-containing protein [Paracoccus sp. SSJ]|uniref:integrase core domain-containing protein n=1 Tax=Paracoccus sp. SSJ TaxID=3050636 RepID=UPI0033077B13
MAGCSNPSATSRRPKPRNATTLCWKPNPWPCDSNQNASGNPGAVHARELTAAWVADYNTARPHSALGYQTPAGFALHLTTAIARPAARDKSFECRAIAQTAPKGVNHHRAPVEAG